MFSLWSAGGRRFSMEAAGNRQASDERFAPSSPRDWMGCFGASYPRRKSTGHVSQQPLTHALTGTLQSPSLAQYRRERLRREEPLELERYRGWHEWHAVWPVDVPVARFGLLGRPRPLCKSAGAMLSW